MPKVFDEFGRVLAESPAHEAISIGAVSLAKEEPQSIGDQAVSSVHEAVGHIVEDRRTEYFQLEELSARVLALEAKAGEGQKPSIIAHITTFAPEPFLLLKDIEVVLEPSDDEYIANFYDANVSSQGCTSQEAIANLKDLLLSRFDYLDKLPPEKKLGPIPRKQIAVLRDFIRRRD